MAWTRTITFVPFKQYHLSHLNRLSACHFGLCVRACVCVFTRMCKTIPVYKYSSKTENKKNSWRETETVGRTVFLNNLSLQQITLHTDLSSLHFIPFVRSNLVAVRRTWSFSKCNSDLSPPPFRCFPTVQHTLQNWHDTSTITYTCQRQQAPHILTTVIINMFTEDSSLLTCYALSTGKQLPAFRRIFVPPFLLSNIPKKDSASFLGLPDPLFLNRLQLFTSQHAPHPRTLESSASLLKEP